MTSLAVALRLTGLGFYIGLCIVAGVGGGIWLDQVTGWSPWFTVGGVILGSMVAFWGVYKMILPVLYGARPSEMTGKERDK